MVGRALAGIVFFSWNAVFACSFHASSADLLFEPATTVLTSKSQEKLQAFIASTSKFYYLDYVEISGHAGKELVSDQRLQALSLARAAAIRDALPVLKVNPDRIILQGFGTKRLLPEAADSALNARVEISAFGWRTRPIEGRLCGMCLCFEKE